MVQKDIISFPLRRNNGICTLPNGIRYADQVIIFFKEGRFYNVLN